MKVNTVKKPPRIEYHSDYTVTLDLTPDEAEELLRCLNACNIYSYRTELGSYMERDLKYAIDQAKGERI